MTLKRRGRIFAWLHGVMAVIWTLLIIPTLMWWRESVLWVALMSLWANIVGHFGAFQAARSEWASEEDAK